MKLISKVRYLKTGTKFVAALVVAISTAACPVEEDCISKTSPTYNRTYTCEGIKYNVSVPNSCASGGCGLIVDVHGLTMNAEIENAGTYMRRLGRNAENRGAETPYIVIQPNANGIIPSWSETEDEPIYDFMKEAVDVWDIDESRIHFGGFSQGGDMSYRFMCKHSDFIASFAPMSGGDHGGCAPSRNPVLHIHGHLDPLANFDDEALGNRAPYLAAMGNYNAQEIDDGLLHTHTRYTGNGYKWELIEHDSLGTVGGHCMPGGLGLFGCLGSFVAGRSIIDFYIANPK